MRVGMRQKSLSSKSQTPPLKRQYIQHAQGWSTQTESQNLKRRETPPRPPSCRDTFLRCFNLLRSFRNFHYEASGYVLICRGRPPSACVFFPLDFPFFSARGVWGGGTFSSLAASPVLLTFQLFPRLLHGQASLPCHCSAVASWWPSKCGPIVEPATRSGRDAGVACGAACLDGAHMSRVNRWDGNYTCNFQACADQVKIEFCVREGVVPMLQAIRPAVLKCGGRLV